MSDKKIVSFRTESEEDELALKIIDEVAEETEYDRSHILRYQLDRKLSKDRPEYQPIHEHDDNLEDLLKEKSEEYRSEIESPQGSKTNYGLLANAAAAAHRKAEKADFERSDEVADNARKHILNSFPDSPYAQVLREEGPK